MSRGGIGDSSMAAPLSVRALKTDSTEAAAGFADAVQEYELRYTDPTIAAGEIARRLTHTGARFSVRHTDDGTTTIFVSRSDDSTMDLDALKQELHLPQSAATPFRIIVVDDARPASSRRPPALE
jgi:hypothetical protein